MRKVCLTLPTNRPCAETISAVGDEAAYAAGHFDAEVYLLILDSSDPDTFARHAEAARRVRETRPVTVHHLDEAAQRGFLQRVIDHAGAVKPDLVLDLMLPAGVSYGACTNRAFLIAAALGCDSVHRRDSDSRYQYLDGEPLYPVHHELTSLGLRAGEAATRVDANTLAERHAGKPVTMVGSSFVGELSVDIGEIHAIDPGIYHDIVSLWAPADWSGERKRRLVEESFKGAGSEPFTADHAVLTVVDPMRVDMCNISFHRVHEQVPLPPATDTIGSDYFLIHLVHDAALPGVLHNRNIVNFHTPERKTGQGFTGYQLRLVKFFLSMLYFNAVYARMAEAGEALLDEENRIRTRLVAGFVRDATALDTTENVKRLRSLDRSYRALGGRYAAFADLLASRTDQLLDEAQADTEDFAFLIEAWEPLVRASRAVGFPVPHRDR
ncbi:DUF6271 family protein [Streptantibioticus cattleyicolor]|uniref:Uncharacterized protein n=1 Tax=Streptantibioticus cattleyicolor (strain ATCC 35852 / DSM 46488 / JCM 4925 / NBRC 14057 / NRRL 8057) TaxID=1003195 RepID=F8JMH4_STREN|nr:DUF6271 family protein [Streptantibioticus cattleyicolor]AEW99347.1 hypothetical protein SCATT_p11540 [Streptantibioticus cattleyicolor NRRL 8057 = DSM 46488]CCB71612.1 conserved protein of unknown function [Streptantibioticus cattleyicolor NRRL 8057 = DSM 46488]